MPALNATTDDVWLRELEFKTLTDALTQSGLGARARILDVGCGDGHTTLRLSHTFPQWTFQGVDYSDAMIGNARRNSAQQCNASAVQFGVARVERLAQSFTAAPFDAILTVRCLINLANDEAQSAAIAEIAQCLRPGGQYFAIENFRDGHDAMNAARATMGLKEIPIRWHNHYFTTESFAASALPWFDAVQVVDFASSYYLATRVLYSAWCSESGATIDYHHPLHHLAVNLPAAGGFAPVRMVILKRRKREG